MFPTLLRCRRVTRRPVALLSAVCTGTFVGLFMFDRFVLNVSSCAASCSAHLPPSYQRLKGNESSGAVKHHPRVKSFEANFLPSNSPMEDRFVVGESRALTSALFSVIDGHKGHNCASYLQKHLLQHVTSSLYSCAELTSKPDLAILMDMDSHQRPLLYEDVRQQTTTGGGKSIPLETMKLCLQDSFQSLDDNISREALEDLKLVHQGHSLTADMKQRVMRAIEGACVIAAIVQVDEVFVANTGDCRVVVGREGAGGRWEALPLSVDQNAENPDEVARLRAEHPGEENTVIMNGRVLGNLMPFRTFGDCDFKWEKKYLENIVYVPATYRSPPYITAKPIISHSRLQVEDKFMIIASDGLWERMSSEEAVNVVSKTLSGQSRKSGMFSSLFGRENKDCCPSNAATELLWQALGGEERVVARLLDVSPTWSRTVRDDITVMVVYF